MFTAKISTTGRHHNVTVTLSASASGLRRDNERGMCAMTHRIAAELYAHMGDLMAAVAVDAHEGRVTLELASGASVEAATAVMKDALSACRTVAYQR